MNDLKLTDTDKKILQSYKTVIIGLGQYFGTSYEFVLHSLENLDASVISLAGGNLTNRKIGAPITNLAINMLSKLSAKGSEEKDVFYFVKNENVSFRSATVPIHGENDRIIGLICINFNLNTPLSDFLNIFNSHDTQVSSNTQNETYAHDTDDLIEKMLVETKDKVYNNNTIRSNSKNKEIIRILYDQGAFNFKNAVQIISEKLNISKNTVYLHMRNISQ